MHADRSRVLDVRDTVVWRVANGPLMVDSLHGWPGGSLLLEPGLPLDVIVARGKPGFKTSVDRKSK
jgi:hypothetical protein